MKRRVDTVTDKRQDVTEENNDDDDTRKANDGNIRKEINETTEKRIRKLYEQKVTLHSLAKG